MATECESSPRMPYRCNINHVLFQDRNSELLRDLARLSCTSLFGDNIFNKQCDHVFCRLVQCLENQLLNMSCMESGNDIHLERITGCQLSVPRLDTTNGELGLSGAYPIEYRRGQPVQTRALASKSLCLLVPLIYWRVPYSE